MSANFNNGTLRPLNRTPQVNSSSSTNETSSSSAAGGGGGGGSVIETVRQRMQQMKDELESSQDQLHAYQNEREREKHAREQVCTFFSFFLLMRTETKLYGVRFFFLIR